MQYSAISNLKAQRLQHAAWSAFVQDIHGLERRRNPISTHHVASAYRGNSRQISVHKTLHVTVVPESIDARVHQ